MSKVWEAKHCFKCSLSSANVKGERQSTDSGNSHSSTSSNSRSTRKPQRSPADANVRLHSTARLDPQKMRLLVAERYREEAEQCTFTPVVCAHSDDSGMGMFDRAEATQNSLSRRSIQALYDAFLQKRVEETECTFSPDIDHSMTYKRVLEDSPEINGVDKFVRLQRQARAMKEETESPPRGEGVRRQNADITRRMKGHRKKLQKALDGILNQSSGGSARETTDRKTQVAGHMHLRSTGNKDGGSQWVPLRRIGHKMPASIRGMDSASLRETGNAGGLR